MQGKKFRFADFEADFSLRELRKSGNRIGLQHKPFHVLELLLSNAGQLVTRQELVDHLWPDSHVSFERSLNSAVNSLRHVLGEGHYIETRPGLGYRFIAPVQEITENATEALQDCLKGRYLLDRLSEEDSHKALAYFHSAAADHACAPLAHAGIADAYCQLATIGSVPSARVGALARSSAELAIEGDPGLPQAHISHARVKMLFDWDWSSAREALHRAKGLAPASVLEASLHCALGDDQAALESCRRALVMDPLSFPASLQLAACSYAARDFHSAVDQCWKLLNLSPEFAPAHLWLALAYQQMGMQDEAVVEFQHARLCSACRVQALSGLASHSEEAFAELSQLAATRHVSGYWHAVVFAAQGQHEQALSNLENAFQLRDPALLAMRCDPRLDGLRGSSRFQSMLSCFS
jgi:DNA-binding winged helix-turn-helix (wHTH) protein